VRNLTFDEALEDFHLSCRAKGLSRATLDHYKSSADMYVAYIKEKSVEHPGDVTSEWVNQFLDPARQRCRADGQRHLADAPVHAIARGAKGLLKFWYSEAYLTSPIAAPMPRSVQKFPSFLAQDHMRTILSRCLSRRDEALLVNTGRKLVQNHRSKSSPLCT
jgi:site-specific recombinase XerD